MYKMEQFIQASILLIILTIVSVFYSAYPYYISCPLCGMLMIVFTVRSLTERQGGLWLVLQILISALFAVLSLPAGCMASCLIFYECRINRKVQLALPSVGYLVISTVTGGCTLPEMLFGAMLILAFAIGIHIAENLVISYLSARNQIARAVSVTAVNEMYERKLNQELMQKNWLAEKNARLEERENISRNIHNSVGHSITAAIMTLDAADMLFDTAPEQAHEKMNIANARIRTSLNSIRQAVRLLDSENKYISMRDFTDELTVIIDSFVMDTTIKIYSDFSNTVREQRIPHEHTEFLTGAMQELFTNGVRHGHADTFTVVLTADSGHLRLSVSDNGKSDFSPRNARERIEKGFGLKKLSSYAKKCGGSAVFENDSGFKTVITLPLYGEEEDE